MEMPPVSSETNYRHGGPISSVIPRRELRNINVALRATANELDSVRRNTDSLRCLGEQNAEDWDRW
jgi:hypothetical protein